MQHDAVCMDHTCNRHATYLHIGGVRARIDQKVPVDARIVLVVRVPCGHAAIKCLECLHCSILRHSISMPYERRWSCLPHRVPTKHPRRQSAVAFGLGLHRAFDEHLAPKIAQLEFRTVIGFVVPSSQRQFQCELDISEAKSCVSACVSKLLSSSSCVISFCTRERRNSAASSLLSSERYRALRSLSHT